jgi:DNA repair exonuclease SbcCD ATPase subunit
MSRTFSASSAVAALLVTCALGACGESKEEKAKAQVCDARSSIQKEVTALSSLTLSTEAPAEAKKHIETIGAELNKIKDAQPNLEPARREQVQTATETFEKEVKKTLEQFTSNLSVSNAESKLKTAGKQLLNGYRQALEPINCS